MQTGRGSAAAVCAAVGALALCGRGAAGEVTTWGPSDLSDDRAFTNPQNWSNGVPGEGVDALFLQPADASFGFGEIDLPATPITSLQIQSRSLRVIGGQFDIDAPERGVVQWDASPFNFDYGQDERSVQVGGGPGSAALAGLKLGLPLDPRPALSRLTSMRVASLAQHEDARGELSLYDWEWLHGGTLHVGERGWGALTIRGRLAGTLTPLDLSIGTGPGSIGSVLIEGSGDAEHALAARAVTVGGGGYGTLRLVGARVHINESLVVGEAAGTTGEIDIGAATQTLPSHVAAPHVLVGDAGTGFLFLGHAAGTLNIGQSLELGRQIGGRGVVEIDHGAATAGGTVHVGGGGRGTLGLFGGGRLASDGGEIAAAYSQPSGIGHVIVTESGSAWTSTGDIRVANDAARQYGDAFASEGRLMVSDGGMVTVRRGDDHPTPGARGRILVNPGGTLAGDGTIDADVELLGAMPGGITSPTVGGVLAPGNSPGTITILGNLTQAPLAQIQFELAPGATDFVDVVGDVTLRGVLTFVALEGFDAPIGAVIPILDAGGNLLLDGAVLDDRTGWGLVLNEPTDAGVLSVTVTAVPEPATTGGLLLLGATLLRRRRPHCRRDCPRR